MTYLLVIGAYKSLPLLWESPSLESPSTVLESICAFKTFRSCLMKLSAVTLDAYRLIIVISFWCISHFISMKCPSLSHLINVSLKSILSDVGITIPACFQEPLTL
jgi:hypothetical protein